MHGVESGGSTPADREAARLEAIRRWRVLEVPPDGFEAVAALAAQIFQVPYAVVSVVDEDRVWFRAHHGLPVDGIDPAPGLCDTVVHTGGPLYLADAREHGPSRSNPLVAGDFGLRFYAGAPLRTSDGYVLGSLAVLDTEPRQVTDREREILTGLAALVVREFELRLAAREQSAADLAVAATEQGRAASLRSAMDTHGVIGQAMGLLISQRRCDSAAAFELLRAVSQRRNRKLADVARALIEDADRQAKAG